MLSIGSAALPSSTLGAAPPGRDDRNSGSRRQEDTARDADCCGQTVRDPAVSRKSGSPVYSCEGRFLFRGTELFSSLRVPGAECLAGFPRIEPELLTPGSLAFPRELGLC